MHPEPKLKFYFPTDAILLSLQDTGNRRQQATRPRIKLTDKLSNIYTNFLGCHSGGKDKFELLVNMKEYYLPVKNSLPVLIYPNFQVYHMFMICFLTSSLRQHDLAGPQNVLYPQKNIPELG